MQVIYLLDALIVYLFTKFNEYLLSPSSSAAIEQLSDESDTGGGAGS